VRATGTPDPTVVSVEDTTRLRAHGHAVRCAMQIEFVIKLEQNSPLTAAVLFKFSYLNAEQRRQIRGAQITDASGHVIFVGPQFGTRFWNIYTPLALGWRNEEHVLNVGGEASCKMSTWKI
jgi:hypothetical protein